jgi:predicted GNAT family acetyltransferase
VYGLLYHDEIAGFICHNENNLVLHAMAHSYRGKGLAKYFWSAVCKQLFDAGHLEVKSSISAANTAAMNLYSSLGFRFRNPIDVYHRIIR